MKIDPYKNKDHYLAWKEENSKLISNVSKENSELILQYLGDMEKGINIAKLCREKLREYGLLVRVFETLEKINSKMSKEEEILKLIESGFKKKG